MSPIFGNDVCSVSFLNLIFLGLGSKLVEREPELHQAGLRLAVVAFLVALGYGGYDLNPSDAQEWMVVAFQALLASGLALGLSWTALTLLAFLYRQAIARPIAAVRRWNEDARRRSDESAARRETDRRARLAQAEYERSAPDRERSRLQAEAEAKGRSEAKKRREDARAGCELALVLHAPDIKDRFSKEQFDAFVSRYMGDDRSPEEVEERARQLQAIIRQHVDRVAPPPKLTSIEDLAHWFVEQKQKIESLPVDGLQKRTHLAELNQRYAELTSQFLERMEP